MSNKFILYWYVYAGLFFCSCYSDPFEQHFDVNSRQHFTLLGRACMCGSLFLQFSWHFIVKGHSAFEFCICWFCPPPQKKSKVTTIVQLFSTVSQMWCTIRADTSSLDFSESCNWETWHFVVFFYMWLYWGLQHYIVKGLEIKNFE